MIHVHKMIETLEGKKLDIPIQDPNIQVYEITLNFQLLNRDGERTYGMPVAVKVVHVCRQTLEKAGLLSDTALVPQKKITTEDLIVEILQGLGVKFEE